MKTGSGESKIEGAGADFTPDRGEGSFSDTTYVVHFKTKQSFTITYQTDGTEGCSVDPASESVVKGQQASGSTASSTSEFYAFEK